MPHPWLQPLAAATHRAWKKDRELCLFALWFWLAWGVFFQVRLVHPDGVGYYAYAQSLVVQGDLSIYDEFGRWGVARPFFALTHLGHVGSFFAVGTAVLWLPFVAVAHLVVLAAAGLGAGVRADGFASPYIYAICFGTSVYGFLALVLSYRVASRFFPRVRAIWATVAIGALSPLWDYLFFDSTCSHAVSAFVDALFVYLFVATRPLPATAPPQRSPAAWFVLGLSGGLVALVRWQEVVLPGLVALPLAYGAVRDRLQRFRRTHPAWHGWEARPVRALSIFSTGAALTFLPQLALWWLQYGRPIALPQGEGFFHLAHPDPFFVLFSSHHGLFSWTPLLLLATVPGLILFARTDRYLGAWAVGCLVAQVYINSIVIDPSAGDSYGARRFVGLSVFYVLGIAALFTRLPPKLSLLATGMAAIWTVPLWIEFNVAAIDRIRRVPYGELLRIPLNVAQHLPQFAGEMRIEALGLLRSPLWVAINAVLWSLFGIAAALFAAFHTATPNDREARSGAEPPVTSISCWENGAKWSLAVVLVINSVVLIAAARSEPAPAPVVRNGSAAMLDFGWYANSRYDADPFEPDRRSILAFPALGEGSVVWGGVPFQFLQPPGDSRVAPSVLTTCYQPAARFSIDLKPVPTQALHFALSTIGPESTQVNVVTLSIERVDGTLLTQTLRRGVDVWDFFSTPRPDHVVYSERGSITGYSLPLGAEPLPVRLTISTPRSAAPVQPCAAFFAITQQYSAPYPAGNTSGFSALDISSIANANAARDPFRPAPVLNHFPDLSPGTLRFRGVPFLVLDHKATPSGESTITTAYDHAFQVRIPLAPIRSERIALLLDGALMPQAPEEVADLWVEYDRGPDDQAQILFPDDVRDYWQPAPTGRVAWHGPGFQDLTYWETPLDANRRPRYLRINGVSERHSQLPVAGVAIFSITQVLARD